MTALKMAANVKESLTVQVQEGHEAATEEYSVVHLRKQDKK